MKTLALFSLSLAVTLGMLFAPGVEQTPVLTEREQSPLLGDWVPVQGHVVVEDPAPQVRPRFEEQKKELAPVPVDMKQSMVEPEIKVEPQVREKQEGEVKTEIKKEPDVKTEPDVKEDLEADVEPEVNLNPEVMAEVTADVEPEVKMKPELNDDPELKVKSEVKVEPDVQEQFQVQMNPEAEIETGREIEERHIDMEGKYEMVGEPIMELEPLNDDNTELSEVEKSLRAAFQNQPLPQEEEGLMRERDYALGEEQIMELEPMDDDKMSEKKLSDTELSDVEKSLRVTFQNQNLVNHPLPEEEEGLMSERDDVLDGEPIMELEPLDDDNTELSDVEKSLRAAFQNQDPVNQLLPEEEEGLMRERDNVLDEEPIMELEPMNDNKMSEEKLSDTELSDVEKSLRVTFQNQNLVNHPLPEEEEGLMRERDNVLDEEPIMELEPMDDDKMSEEKLSDTELSDVEKSLRATFQNQNPVNQPLPEEEEGFMREWDNVLDGEPYMELEPMDDDKMSEEKKNPEETRSSPNQDKQERSHCPGVILEGKCYQFFKGPKPAADAEFFCQEHAAGGHLASITGQHIHREVMNMMLRQNGALTRSWIGGLRYLKTGRFIWLDGSHWSYADWLSGEPNNTADIEDCVEVLAHGNGKFNDFTCREPQAFICSYPYQ
ncbi:myb-like protein X [Cebidichthys violaceus]|uniref:myb-like protein X n=1 Tax=Cebidichthys violaceus TaxID=271503 RepID=UPI0035CC7910